MYHVIKVRSYCTRLIPGEYAPNRRYTEGRGGSTKFVCKAQIKRYAFIADLSVAGATEQKACGKGKAAFACSPKKDQSKFNSQGVEG